MTFQLPSLSLSNEGASTMTYYELDRPRAATGSGIFSRIGNALEKTIRAIQYSRMMQALSELSDAQLSAIGLTRADIPRRAHECIYGEDA